MATSASRSRLFPARTRNAYRLELEGRTLYLLLSLMTLTGVVIFYLGVVTGKALRDPNAPVTLATQAGAPAEAAQGASPTPATESLAFGEALKAAGTGVEALRAQSEDASRRTERLLSDGQQLRLEEVTPSGPSKPQAPRAPVAAMEPNVATPSAPAPGTPTVEAAAPAAQPRMAQPAAVDAPDEGLYTVQVFSSQQQENARQLMDKLRSQGFSAYLNRYEAADKQVWYRVRVGRTDRAGAEQIETRLRTEANLKNPQIQKL